MPKFKNHYKFRAWGIIGAIIIIAVFVALLWLWLEPNKMDLPAPSQESSEIM